MYYNLFAFLFQVIFSKLFPNINPYFGKKFYFLNTINILSPKYVFCRHALLILVYIIYILKIQFTTCAILSQILLICNTFILFFLYCVVIKNTLNFSINFIVYITSLLANIFLQYIYALNFFFAVFFIIYAKW